ncbi:MAG TPA: DUF2784 domain-containing protein [Bryobacteraceae bacterium]|nr:DUF2784 domain-containing protein [Bryobacteraceae bacterium]
MPEVYGAIAALILAVHAIWILWVVFGALWTRTRRWLACVHILSLAWGVVAEAGPWPCPLTLAEQFFEDRAGRVRYHGSFLVYYLDKLVYPGVSATLLVWCAVGVCTVNVLVYWRRWRHRHR